MTRNEILARYPHASASFIRANLSAEDTGADGEPIKRQEKLDSDNEGQAQDAGCLHCRIALKRKSLLDVDAKYASVKDLLDCLTIAGVIRGDKEGQITLEVPQTKCRKGEAEEITVEVWKIANDQAQRPPAEQPES